MAKKDPNKAHKTSFNLTTLNRELLKQSGFIDGRSGHSKVNTRKGVGLCLGDFINECITLVYQSRGHKAAQIRDLSTEQQKALIAIISLEIERRRLAMAARAAGNRLDQIELELELLLRTSGVPSPSPPAPPSPSPETNGEIELNRPL